MKRTTATTLSGLLIGVVFSLLLPPQIAWAAPCTGATEIHVRAVPDTNGRGAKSPSMVTFNPSVTCAHISSIGVRSTSIAVFTESGWIENPAGYISCATTSGAPIWFVFYVRANGTYRCVSGTALSASDPPHSYAVHDVDQDGVWNLLFDDVTKATPDMGTFVTGQPIANGERRVSADPGHVDIQQLWRMNSTPAWVNWTGTYVPSGSDGDSDPTYNACTSKFPTELEVTSTC